ncbi:MAG: Gfo/Idh/MocA family oxidoreductase [Desulfobacteraceae bacterium]|jgi:predicted dehydrogenase|nr:Gfo/Idh/MocA family oxidoreductase [Desulfobacteraceae bacterium]
MINVGLIGYGYWGPNLARNFNLNPDMNLVSICDFAPDRLKKAAALYPQTNMVDTVDDFYKKNHLDAVAIATPVSAHYDLARQALRAGMHVWLEKPMTDNVDHAKELTDLALKGNRTLLLDHTFVYTGAVRKIKSLIDEGELGELLYYDSTRVNLGLFQQDVDVIWDLAPHDISILDYLMPMKKVAVSATGSCCFANNMIAKSILSIYMDNEVIAHINTSWVSPVKIRQTLIGGSAKMVLYDDNQPSEKIKVYDKGVHLFETKEDLYRMNVQYRVGDMWAPKIDNLEALALETEHFVDCISNGKEPLTGGPAGLEVVKVLVASKESLANRGAPVELV